MLSSTPVPHVAGWQQSVGMRKIVIEHVARTRGERLILARGLTGWNRTNCTSDWNMSVFCCTIHTCAHSLCSWSFSATPRGKTSRHRLVRLGYLDITSHSWGSNSFFQKSIKTKNSWYVTLAWLAPNSAGRAWRARWVSLFAELLREIWFCKEREKTSFPAVRLSESKWIRCMPEDKTQAKTSFYLTAYPLRHNSPTPKREAPQQIRESHWLAAAILLSISCDAVAFNVLT